MSASLILLNQSLSFGIIVIQAICLLLVFTLIFNKKKDNKFLSFFGKNAFLFGFIVSFGAVVFSLIYSNIIGFAPCELCWIQRIFLYPQVVLFGLALIKKDNSIIDYSLALALIGGLISIYHIYIERGGQSILPCSANGVSCSIRYVYEFSYVTIPIMAFSISFFIFLLLITKRNISKFNIINSNL